MKLRVFIFAVFVFLAKAALAQTGVLSTVAGTGTAIDLAGPYAVAVDSAGNIYIADHNNNRVIRVPAGGGSYTTIGAFDHPQDVTVSPSGLLFVADSRNDQVARMTTSGGGRTVVAGNGDTGFSGDGGAATAATLNDPAGVIADGAGNFYIADQANHRIRRVTSNGTISTFAGTGDGGFSGDGGPASAAQINNPVHFAFDSAGNLYIADYNNHRVRKVSASTGIITTVAGSTPNGGQGGYSGDGGPATAALLNNPAGVAVDSAGNIYIADASNGRIRKVNAGNGVITTVAGGGNNDDGCSAVTSKLGFPVGLWLTPAGNLYIADYGDNRVRVLTVSTEGPPVTTSISPSSGAPGTTRTVTLTGTGLSTSAGGSGCTAGVTTAAVDGTGVTVSNVSVNSSTSVNVTLVIAANAALGPRNVRLTNERGTSNPQTFTVALPLPTLTSISPSSGLRGTAVGVTLTGTNFVSTSGGTTVAISGTGIAITSVNVVSATSITANFNIVANAPLGNYSVTVTTAGGTSNSVNFAVTPPGPSFTFGIPATLNPTQQAPLGLGILSPSPDPVTGQLILTFTPNASTPDDDPTVRFVNAQTSSRTINFTIPANTSGAQFAVANTVLQAGTVAGTIRLTVTGVQVGSTNVTPFNSTFDVVIPRLAPVITNVRILNRTPTGFDIEVTGYSDSKDITQATFQFAPATGANLITTQLQPAVTATFTTYYQTPASAAVGSAFVYVQPIIVTQGDSSAVGTITVTLSNASGTSQPRTAN